MKPPLAQLHRPVRAQVTRARRQTAALLDLWQAQGIQTDAMAQALLAAAADAMRAKYGVASALALVNLMSAQLIAELPQPAKLRKAPRARS
jgi:hypothetical protein